MPGAVGAASRRAWRGVGEAFWVSFLLVQAIDSWREPGSDDPLVLCLGRIWALRLIVHSLHLYL